MQLENKVAIVTGSSLGIGRSVALALAREGAAVAVNHRSHPDEGREVARRIEAGGGRAISVGADVCVQGEVEDLVGSTVEEFGRLDVMVNNAGAEEKHPFVETPLEAWEKTIAVNLETTTRI